MILIATVAGSLYNIEGLLSAATFGHEYILDEAGWLFLVGSFAAVIIVPMAALSPLGRVRIGGIHAKPILSRWNWFAITLCTTIATGILFWGTAEPLMHYNAPAGFSGVAPRSNGAETFALATLYLHWSFTPYAIYTAPALAFALAYHNLGRPYSLSSPLRIAVGSIATGAGAAVIDGIALFALVAGVAASLGAGMLTLADGLSALFGAPDGPTFRAVVGIFIVFSFVASSVSGLQRGIRVLSDLNVRIFFAFAVFIFIAGPSVSILRGMFLAVGEYIATFVPRSLAAPGGDVEQWRREWTMFNFANWSAWAPITALFLGRIAVGYTVREFFVFTLVVPALFGMAWMSIFGGATIGLDQMTSGLMTAALRERGPEGVIYAVLGELPFTAVIVPLFLFTTFVSFVTAMDSNTDSISNVCVGSSHKADRGPDGVLWVKIFWGALIGAVAWIMTATSGIAGVRMLSNLGGLPGLLIVLASLVALVRLMLQPTSSLHDGVVVRDAASAQGA